MSPTGGYTTQILIQKGSIKGLVELTPEMTLGAASSGVVHVRLTLSMCRGHPLASLGHKQVLTLDVQDLVSDQDVVMLVTPKGVEQQLAGLVTIDDATATNFEFLDLIIVGLLPGHVDLEDQDDHCNSQSYQGGDENASERSESDALRVICDGAESPLRVVPIFAGQGFEVSVLLKGQDRLADIILEMTALLDSHRIRLFGERITDLGQVAVVVVFILDLEFLIHKESSFPESKVNK